MGDDHHDAAKMGDGIHPNHPGSPRNNCAVGVEHVDDIEGCPLFLMLTPCSSFGQCLWFTSDFGEVSTVESSP